MRCYGKGALSWTCAGEAQTACSASREAQHGSSACLNTAAKLWGLLPPLNLTDGWSTQTLAAFAAGESDTRLVVRTAASPLHAHCTPLCTRPSHPRTGRLSDVPLEGDAAKRRVKAAAIAAPTRPRFKHPVSVPAHTSQPRSVNAEGRTASGTTSPAVRPFPRAAVAAGASDRRRHGGPPAHVART